MTEQPGERRVTAGVEKELISLMVPDLDPELVQLALSRAARSAARGRKEDEGGAGEPRAGLLREYLELLALIRDAGIGRARLRVILGLSPEALPAGDDDPRPPVR